MSDKWKEAAAAALRIGLPTIGAFLAGGPIGAGAAAVSSIARELGADPNDPEQITRQLQTNPEATIKLQEIEADLRKTEIAAAAQQAIAESQAEAQESGNVNETMRAEMAAQDNYRGRWRPTYGYAVTIVMVMLSLTYSVLLLHAGWQSPQQLVEVIKAFGDASAGAWPIVVAVLAVLGVAVKQRSNDKARAMGQAPPRLLDRLFDRQLNTGH
jgi:hypothetical protein